MNDQSEKGMYPKDVFILSTDTHLALIPKGMTYAWPLKAIPAIQSGLAKSA
jgi:hypothetical protein